MTSLFMTLMSIFWRLISSVCYKMASQILSEQRIVLSIIHVHYSENRFPKFGKIWMLSKGTLVYQIVLFRFRQITLKSVEKQSKMTSMKADQWLLQMAGKWVKFKKIILEDRSLSVCMYVCMYECLFSLWWEHRRSLNWGKRWKARKWEYYTIIDFNEVDIRIYLPVKVIIHRGR